MLDLTQFEGREIEYKGVKFLVRNDGAVWHKKKGWFFGYSSSKEYKMIMATFKGKRLTCLVHRLIALAFIQNPENKPQVNHKNGIRTDNRIDNLEWVTCSENLKHSFNESPLADKNRKIQRERMLGKKQSDDHKKRISESQKQRYRIAQEATK